MNKPEKLDPETGARVASRLIQLREEYAAGETQLQAMEQRMRDLKNTMLRIAGAIAVLEELHAQGSSTD